MEGAFPAQMQIDHARNCCREMSKLLKEWQTARAAMDGVLHGQANAGIATGYVHDGPRSGWKRGERSLRETFNTTLWERRLDLSRQLQAGFQDMKAAVASLEACLCAMRGRQDDEVGHPYHEPRYGSADYIVQAAEEVIGMLKDEGKMLDAVGEEAPTCRDREVLLLYSSMALRPMVNDGRMKELMEALALELEAP